MIKWKRHKETGVYVSAKDVYPGVIAILRPRLNARQYNINQNWFMVQFRQYEDTPQEAYEVSREKCESFYADKDGRPRYWRVATAKKKAERLPFESLNKLGIEIDDEKYDAYIEELLGGV